MIFRKTEKKDISEVLEIIESAKERMKNMGLDQWQKGFEFCGVIYLDREPDLNAKRVTFEKILEKKEV